MRVKKLPVLSAWFQPQAWIDDYAVNIDGGRAFDAAKAVLQLRLIEITKLRDDSYASDDLLPRCILDRHNGPFYVAIEGRIEDFFDELGLKLDASGLRKARKLYGVRCRK